MDHWEFELVVTLPDGVELVYRVGYPPEYMDQSLMENLLFRLGTAAVEETKARGLLN